MRLIMMLRILLLFFVSSNGLETIMFNPSAAADSVVRHIRMVIPTRWIPNRDELFEGCSSTSVSVINDPLQWPYSGLYSFSQAIKLKYGPLGQGTAAARERAYASKTKSYQSTAKADLIANYTLLTECVADSADDADLSLLRSMCSCMSRGSAERECTWAAAFASQTQCLDEYRKRVDWDEICPIITGPDQGVSLSERCSGWVAGTIEALDLYLYNLNKDSATPDTVISTYYSREYRTYYLIHKALERFIRYTDVWLSCTEPVIEKGRFKSLEETALNFNPLPKWNTKIMWWISNSIGEKAETPIKQQMSPIAILASHGIETSCKITNDISSDDSSDDSNDENILILVRDARTTFEAKIGYLMDGGREYAPDKDTPFVHGGYDHIAKQIIPGIVGHINKWLKSKARVRPTITYAGYGQLGSGVAAIIAHDISKQFPYDPKTKTLIYHDLVVFGGGRVGDWKFNKELATRVNVRSIGKHGLMDYPCPSPRGCSLEYPLNIGDNTGVTLGNYLPLPGQVEPKIKLKDFDLNAEINCATSCWIHNEACPDDINSRCSHSTSCLTL